jgi:archaetidylinositol phosphate synthase
MTAKREMTFLLANPERRLLRGIARRLPRSIRSNHLSALGVLGAVGAGVAYAMGGFDVRWLWVSSAMLVLNWFGDSLDGTLARVRGVERPNFGYYLDHVLDAFSTAVVGIGIGLSPFVSFPVALAAVIVYLMMAINIYLESSVFGVFRLAYGVFGPTEARIALIMANTGLAILVAPGAMAPMVTSVGSAFVGLLGGIMMVMLLVRFVRNLFELSRLEPMPEMGSKQEVV